MKNKYLINIVHKGAVVNVAFASSRKSVEAKMRMFGGSEGIPHLKVYEFREIPFSRTTIPHNGWVLIDDRICADKNDWSIQVSVNTPHYSKTK